jgi:hypothetical protein
MAGRIHGQGLGSIRWKPTAASQASSHSADREEIIQKADETLSVPSPSTGNWGAQGFAKISILQDQ